MKKMFFLIAALAATLTAGAQSDNDSNNDADSTARSGDRRVWIDFRFSESFGLNRWSDQAFVNNHLPRTMSTDFKATLNIMTGGPVGIFFDMGFGIMPGARNNSYDMGNFPTPKPGTQYYIREMITDHPGPDPSASFKMTTGVFGRIKTSSRFAVMPAVGIGFMTMTLPSYEVLLKEQGSNIQYRAAYSWFTASSDQSADAVHVLGRLTGRLTFGYTFSEHAKLLFGLEYTWIFTPVKFSTTFTNDFNSAITKTFVMPGNRMNMFGVMIGIAL